MYFFYTYTSLMTYNETSVLKAVQNWIYYLVEFNGFLQTTKSLVCLLARQSLYFFSNSAYNWL